MNFEKCSKSHEKVMKFDCVTIQTNPSSIFPVHGVFPSSGISGRL